MTSIQIQGGGIIDQCLPGLEIGTIRKTGYASALDQLNTAMAVRISDTNLNDFSNAGVFVHPMSADALVRIVGPTGQASPLPGPPAPRSGARA